MHFEWKGVFPALTTQFAANDELDIPLFEKNLEAQLDAGVDGIVLGGSLGRSECTDHGRKRNPCKNSFTK
jgi:dihydrodipicolinate synthase/N-acetylneuraminate lyase